LAGEGRKTTTDICCMAARHGMHSCVNLTATDVTLMNWLIDTSLTHILALEVTARGTGTNIGDFVSDALSLDSDSVLAALATVEAAWHLSAIG
jgi:hypothetical protein